MILYVDYAECSDLRKHIIFRIAPKQNRDELQTHKTSV